MPVTAAAAVIALAVSLVLIRDIPNGPVVPAAKPAPSETVPEYYVALPEVKNSLPGSGVPAAVFGIETTAGNSYLNVVRIYSVATGALLRQWTGRLAPAQSPGYATLSWTADGRQLAIVGVPAPAYFGVWMLDMTRPGHDLTADSRGRGNPGSNRMVISAAGNLRAPRDSL